MSNTLELTPIHSYKTFWWVDVFYLINGQLLKLKIGTPNFNDYNEWRISQIIYSKDVYDAAQNEGPLCPLDIPAIEFSTELVHLLRTASEAYSFKSYPLDPEVVTFFNDHPVHRDGLSGVQYTDGFFVYAGKLRGQERIDRWLVKSTDELDTFLYKVLHHVSSYFLNIYGH